MSNIERQIEHVDKLAADLKEARKELNETLESTEMYQKILTVTLKQTKAHALKVTLANYKKTKQDE